MPRIVDKELKTLRGLPGGVNNVSPDQDIPKGEDGMPLAAREVVNFDLVGPSKKPRLRAGYTQKIEGRTHSPAVLDQNLFMVIDGDLIAYDTTLTPVATLRTGVGQRRLSYAEVNGDLYWANGSLFRRLRGSDLSDLPGWIESPGVPDADAVAGYNLGPGTYRLAMTWFDAEGRESGAAGTAEVDVPDGGYGIQVSQITQAPAEAVKGRIYLSPPNDTELYAAIDFIPGATNIIVASSGADGKALETLWLEPMHGCDLLRFWNGLLLGATGPLLRWSAPGGRVGLTHPNNYMRLGMGITLLEPLGIGGDSAGCFVADHKYTYWLAGNKPGAWRRLTKYDHPAVFGTSIQVKGTDIGLETSEFVAFWLAANGVFVAGLPGGTIVQMTDPDALALPGGEMGATLFREHAGLRQLIASFITTGGNRMAIGDKTSATVTRHP